jgi:hypothetical protein
MPCNYANYPKDWKSIIRQIKDQAGDCCEFCGAPNGEHIQRNIHGEWLRWDELSVWNSDAGWRWLGTFDPPNSVTIVLTVAHLDHDRENNDPCNLRALCQRCHLNWDRDRHTAKAAATRRANRLAKTGQLELMA